MGYRGHVRKDSCLEVYIMQGYSVEDDRLEGKEEDGLKVSWNGLARRLMKQYSK